MQAAVDRNFRAQFLKHLQTINMIGMIMTADHFYDRLIGNITYMLE